MMSGFCCKFCQVFELRNAHVIGFFLCIFPAKLPCDKDIHCKCFCERNKIFVVVDGNVIFNRHRNTACGVKIVVSGPSDQSVQLNYSCGGVLGNVDLK